MVESLTRLHLKFDFETSSEAYNPHSRHQVIKKVFLSNYMVNLRNYDARETVISCIEWEVTFYPLAIDVIKNHPKHIFMDNRTACPQISRTSILSLVYHNSILALCL